MEASCGNDWNVLFSYGSDGEIRGFLSYQLRRKLGFSAILPQLLTLYQGVWVLYPEDSTSAHRHILQHEVYEDLATQLSALGTGLYEQSFHYSQFDVEAFVAHGYRHHERCTYILDNLYDVGSVIENLPDRKRRLLRSATYKGLKLNFDMEPEVFYRLYKEELHKKGKKILYTEEYFLSIYYAAKEHGAGQILSMNDEAGNMHAALWVVWDAMSAYTEVLVINHDFRNSGASIGVVIEAMKFVKDKTLCFDFAGSVIPAVAERNEMLGGKKVPYITLQKINHPILKLWRMLKV